MAVNSITQAILDGHEAGQHTSKVLWGYKALVCPTCQHEAGMSNAYMMMRVHGASSPKSERRT